MQYAYMSQVQLVLHSVLDHIDTLYAPSQVYMWGFTHFDWVIQLDNNDPHDFLFLISVSYGILLKPFNYLGHPTRRRFPGPDLELLL